MSLISYLRSFNFFFFSSSNNCSNFLLSRFLTIIKNNTPKKVTDIIMANIVLSI